MAGDARDAGDAGDAGDARDARDARDAGDARQCAAALRGAILQTKGGPKPLFGRGILCEVFLPPPLSTTPPRAMASSHLGGKQRGSWSAKQRVSAFEAPSNY